MRLGLRPWGARASGPSRTCARRQRGASGVETAALRRVLHAKRPDDSELRWNHGGAPPCEPPGFLAEGRTLRASASAGATCGGALARSLRQGPAKPGSSQGGEVTMSQHSRTRSPYHAWLEAKRSELLAERAHRMRHGPTVSEATLWAAAARVPARRGVTRSRSRSVRRERRVFLRQSKARSILLGCIQAPNKC